MPHVKIKHFPASINDHEKEIFIKAVSSAVLNLFKCDLSAISIAMEPVEIKDWRERVYEPEIIQQKKLLIKLPDYTPN